MSEGNGRENLKFVNMISDTIKYIGVDDLDIDLFESQYVVPEGMSYNSYLIDDGTDCLDAGDLSRIATGV